MKGAIIGDIIGSSYEHQPTKELDFELFTARTHFTDDTVMTIATIDSLINSVKFSSSQRKWGLKYPNAGYGPSFFGWIHSDDKLSYHSFGNGSAMRVSPCGYLASSEEEAIHLATLSAITSHNHPEGIRGAQAVALAVFYAKQGLSKAAIKSQLQFKTGYDLSQRYCDFQPWAKFDVSCMGSVPQAIICFLESDDFESSIRLAVALGGDADTQACIAGGIAEAFYSEIPNEIENKALSYLDEDLSRMLANLYK